MWGQGQLWEMPCSVWSSTFLLSALHHPSLGEATSVPPRTGCPTPHSAQKLPLSLFLFEIQTWGEHPNMAKIEEGSYNS